MKVVRKGGLPSETVGKARLEQILSGEIESDLLMIQLRLRERVIIPPLS